MRNLAVFGQRGERLQLADDEKLQAAAVDSDHGRVFFVSDHYQLYWMALSDDQHLQHSIPLFGASVDDDLQSRAVAGIEYMIELEAVVIGMESGDLLLAEPSSGHVEVVGTLQGGIRSMAASPDGELLALATGLGQVLLMTPDWDIIYEFSINQPGRNGENETSIFSAGVEICWRADGKYFATNERSAVKNLSHIKIWEREAGTLHSCCDALPTSETAITWCPGGARIAAACSRSETHEPPIVMIFERNGLKKDSFEITAPVNAEVEALQWNSNGDLLYVLIRCDGWDAIQLWSCSNYHWYLKQERRCPLNDVVKILWHPERAFCAIAWTVSGSMEVVNMGWKSAVLGSSTAFVIDGPNVLVTPLSISLIPPPMYLFKVKFKAAVNTVAFTSGDTEFITIAVSLSDGSLGLASLSNISTWADLEGSDFEGSTLQNFDGGLRDLAFVNANNLCGVMRSDSLHGEDIVEFEVASTGETWTAQSLRQIALDKPVVAVVGRPFSRSSEVFIQLHDGSVISHFVGASGSTAAGKFSDTCPWMQVVEKHEQQVLFVGLDERQKLHIGDTVISEDCASFTLHRTSTKTNMDIVHLIYTTRQDLLHVVNLDKDLTLHQEVLDVSHLAGVNQPRSRTGPGRKLAVQNDFNVRRVWERGARLVGTLDGDDVAVILQTGRGNLETVYPRGLILQAIVAALAEPNFQAAILCARRHRIDLNVIVDFLGENEFSRLASEFVKQVGKLSLVTEFVCSLRKENHLEATYQKTLSSLTSDNKVIRAGSANKVQVVLQALRNALEQEVADSPSRELCMLTILARSDPPLLEEALKRIKTIREGELGFELSDDAKLMGVGEFDGVLTAESALKHLIWLVDADAVFNSALGLYDLHLAAMVASHSQRDPKEFLPFLQELEDKPMHLMRYTIDCKLQRYESALENLSFAGEAYFDEALELIKNHPELFSVGLSIFTEQSKRSMILEAWGDYFLAQEKFEDAAISFCACSQLQKALSAYRAGGLWQGVLVVAGQLNLPISELTNLASELREELQEMGRPKEAARIALDYCKDLEGAVSLLIDARDWVEVLRVCHLNSRADLVERLVGPSAVECSAALVAQFEEGIEKIGKYCARFMAVHQRRLLLEAKLKGEDGEDHVDDDTASETSSNLSGMSVYTRGTSRTTNAASIGGKSKARRQGRIRAGSPGEELALVEHLKGMAITTQLGEELRPLLQLLVFIKRQDIACKLQHIASKFEAAQAEALRQVEEKITHEAHDASVLVTNQKRSLGDEKINWRYQALEFSPL